MLQHKDVLNYLVAIKSFYRFLNSGEIYILNDGSLLKNDIRQLKLHLTTVTIINLNEIKNGISPKDRETRFVPLTAQGCWERILLISDLVRNQYVIQLDADTITLDAVPEVIDCIQNNKCFTLGTNEGKNFESMIGSYNRVKNWNSNHVQVISERRFHRLSSLKSMKYVRGSASFTGFGQNSFHRHDLEEFSNTMSEANGSLWFKWGTEQITSNFIIANASHTCVLPYPKYADYYPLANIPFENSSFLHFSGANRYKNGLYLKKSISVINHLLYEHYK
jgi:hypothetical protein